MYARRFKRFLPVSVKKQLRSTAHVGAEHVFEHLTWDEARAALANISQYLKDGGRIRIAVPDGYWSAVEK